MRHTQRKPNNRNRRNLGGRVGISHIPTYRGHPKCSTICGTALAVASDTVGPHTDARILQLAAMSGYDGNNGRWKSNTWSGYGWHSSSYGTGGNGGAPSTLLCMTLHSGSPDYGAHFGIRNKSWPPRCMVLQTHDALDI